MVSGRRHLNLFRPFNDRNTVAGHSFDFARSKDDLLFNYSLLAVQHHDVWLLLHYIDDRHYFDWFAAETVVVYYLISTLVE